MLNFGFFLVDSISVVERTFQESISWYANHGTSGIFISIFGLQIKFTANISILLWKKSEHIFTYPKYQKKQLDNK